MVRSNLGCARLRRDPLDQQHLGSEALARLLGKTVSGGFDCSLPLVQDPWFDSLRADSDFIRLIHRAEEKSREAADAFTQAGGERLLGVAG